MPNGAFVKVSSFTVDAGAARFRVQTIARPRRVKVGGRRGVASCHFIRLSNTPHNYQRVIKVWRADRRKKKENILYQVLRPDELPSSADITLVGGIFVRLYRLYVIATIKTRLWHREAETLHQIMNMCGHDATCSIL
ncbi:unnamed protein product [Leptidea sinapis]|uniref:Uncharacterized protein n=1 Tax=Leptidea sinapis TaxID=189913 RepID=A0A5E4PNU1_9NEOP|nr:unnamed protein product [Leptidea sinapis]